MTARALELIATRRRDPLRPAASGRRDRRRARRRRADLRRQGAGCGRHGAGGDRAHDGPARRSRVARSSGSRAATPSSSAAAARRRRRSPTAGIPFEVVPGVTAGIAAPAYAGIPVTHRDDASAVAFVTGHEDPEKGESAIDWPALAAFPGTLVLYMGVKNLPLIAERLIEAGRDPDEPAAAVERGTHPDQRTVVATTATPAGRRRRGRARRARDPALRPGRGPARARSPGSSAGRCTGGEWSSPGRAPRPAGCADRLRGLGADVVELPAIRIEPRIDTPEVAAMLDSLHSYALVCLTSPNGAELLLDAMAERGLDARALAQRDGRRDRPRYGSALRARGVIADIVPPRSIAESLVESLREVEVERAPRAGRARGRGPRRAARGAGRARRSGRRRPAVRDGHARAPTDAAIERARNADYVTFTSSSTVRYFTEAVGDRLPIPGPDRLDRPGDERDRARARPRGRRRGEAPRPRRPDRGARRRRGSAPVNRRATRRVGSH